MPNKTTIGNVAVHRGEPDGGNPYRGASLMGPERVAALCAFRDGTDCSAYTYWHAPADGGAYRISDPAAIDWTGMNR